jgi:GT2 family glycosyltransferase
VTPAPAPRHRTRPVRVAAIVVTWNSAAHVGSCLASLETQDHDALEVVVVDNASTDGTLALLEELLRGRRRTPLRVVRNTSNRGFAGGVNDGLATLDVAVDAVLLVNPDVVLEPDTVRHLVDALAADPARGSVQPKLLRSTPAPDGAAVLDTTGHVLTHARLVQNRGEGERDVGQHDTPGAVFGASGALVLHRRAMLADVAWRRPDGASEVLTEDLVAYFDDVELDWRARLLGWRCWYEPAAVATHERGGAGPRRTPRVEALNFSNRLLVLATCDDAASLLRAAPVVVTTTALKLVELTVTVPRAVPSALWRCGRYAGASLRRRRELSSRAVLPRSEVVATYTERFRYGPWISTWWRRITGRSLGVSRPRRRPRPRRPAGSHRPRTRQGPRPPRGRTPR